MMYVSGCMSVYVKLGLMTGRSYEDTVQILIKSLKNRFRSTVTRVCSKWHSASSQCIQLKKIQTSRFSAKYRSTFDIIVF